MSAHHQGGIDMAPRQQPPTPTTTMCVRFAESWARNQQVRDRRAGGPARRRTQRTEAPVDFGDDSPTGAGCHHRRERARAVRHRRAGGGLPADRRLRPRTRRARRRWRSAPRPPTDAASSDHSCGPGDDRRPRPPSTPVRRSARSSTSATPSRPRFYDAYLAAGARRHPGMVGRRSTRGSTASRGRRSPAGSSPPTRSAPRRSPAAASPSNTSYQEVSDYGAFYCPDGDFMVYDDGELGRHLRARRAVQPVGRRRRPGPRVRPRRPVPRRRPRSRRADDLHRAAGRLLLRGLGAPGVGGRRSPA